MGHGFSLGAIKIIKGPEGPGFRANLYEHGKKVGTVLDDAWGAPLQFDFPDQEAKKRLDAAAKAMPRVVDDRYPDPHDKGKPFSYQPDADYLVTELFNDYLHNKAEQKLQRKCQTKTLVALHSDKDDSYWVFNAPYSPKLADKFRQKYGADLKEIINERFLSLTGYPKAVVSIPVKKGLIDHFLGKGETIHSGKAQMVWVVTEACRERNLPYRVEALYVDNIEEPVGVRVSNPDCQDGWPEAPGRSVKVLEEFSPDLSDNEDATPGPR